MYTVTTVDNNSVYIYVQSLLLTTTVYIYICTVTTVDNNSVYIYLQLLLFTTTPLVQLFCAAITKLLL